MTTLPKPIHLFTFVCDRDGRVRNLAKRRPEPGNASHYRNR